MVRIKPNQFVHAPCGLAVMFLTRTIFKSGYIYNTGYGRDHPRQIGRLNSEGMGARLNSALSLESHTESENCCLCAVSSVFCGFAFCFFLFLHLKFQARLHMLWTGKPNAVRSLFGGDPWSKAVIKLDLSKSRRIIDSPRHMMHESFIQPSEAWALVRNICCQLRSCRHFSFLWDMPVVACFPACPPFRLKERAMWNEGSTKDRLIYEEGMGV